MAGKPRVRHFYRLDEARPRPAQRQQGHALRIFRSSACPADASAGQHGDAHSHRARVHKSFTLFNREQWIPPSSTYDWNGCRLRKSLSGASLVRRETRPTEAALDFGEDDVLCVTKLGRLARSTQHLLDIVERVKREGANVQVLGLGIDMSTATGQLVVTIIAAIACFEREMMLERQREGIAKAKAERRYKGRKPTARAKTARSTGQLPRACVGFQALGVQRPGRSVPSIKSPPTSLGSRKPKKD